MQTREGIYLRILASAMSSAKVQMPNAKWLILASEQVGTGLSALVGLHLQP
jgi:hypothetical protein